MVSHYRTHAGAEVDLVLSLPDGRTHAVEIKRTLSPKVTPSLIESMNTINADKATIIIPAGTPFTLPSSIDVMPLSAAMRNVWM